MQKRQLYLRIFANLLIPVLGFWVWDWSLYFILLFYILDILSSEVVMHLKSRKIRQIHANGKELIKVPTKIYALVSFLFLAFVILEINIGIVLLHPEINIQQEIITFLAYKELGIPQGIVLLPLVAIMAYTSYKTEFLLPKLYLRQNEKTVWKQHLKTQFLLLSFCVLLTLLAVAFHFSETVVLIVILVISNAYLAAQQR